MHLCRMSLCLRVLSPSKFPRHLVKLAGYKHPVLTRRFGLAARLLTGLRTYLLPEVPGAPLQQAHVRGRGTAAQRRRGRHAEARPAGKDINVRGQLLG